MGERCEELARGGVIGAVLDDDDPGAGGRQPYRGVEEFTGPVREAETPQARERRDHHIGPELPGVQAADPPVGVAPDGHGRQLRMQGAQECRAAGCAGADPGAGREVCEGGGRMSGREYEDVAGVLAGQDGADGDARCPVMRAGQVLGAGDGRLDAAVEEVLVGAAGEGSLPADLGEGPVVRVAFADDLVDVEGDTGMPGGEGVCEAAGLLRRHGARAGPEPDRTGGYRAGHGVDLRSGHGWSGSNGRRVSTAWRVCSGVRALVSTTCDAVVGSHVAAACW